MINDGKYYETKTAQILRSLRPNERIQENVKLIGKLSRSIRQIDVLVEPRDFDLLLFEYKDHSRPIDLDVFGSFCSLLDDINIERAAVVSNSPYTKGVINLANAKKIELLHLVDSNDFHIRTRLKARVLLIDSKLKRGQIKLQTSTNITKPFPRTPTIQGPHFSGQWWDYLRYLWNHTDLLSKETGTYEYVIENVSILSSVGKSLPIESITFIYSVDKEHYLGGLEITNTQGIYNTKEGSYQTKSFETVPLNASDVEKKWQLVSEADAPQTKVTMGICCKSILG